MVNDTIGTGSNMGRNVPRLKEFSAWMDRNGRCKSNQYVPFFTTWFGILHKISYSDFDVGTLCTYKTLENHADMVWSFSHNNISLRVAEFSSLAPIWEKREASERGRMRGSERTESPKHHSRLRSPIPPRTCFAKTLKMHFRSGTRAQKRYGPRSLR